MKNRETEIDKLNDAIIKEGIKLGLKKKLNNLVEYKHEEKNDNFRF